MALSRVSMNIEQGRIHGIIGPNGSGKSTLFNVITRVLRQDEGSVYYKDKRIDVLSSSSVAQLGIGRTFQFTRVFRKLTVLENLMAVTAVRDRHATDRARKVLSDLGLDKMSNKRAGTLPIGQRKLVEFARVLVTNPELILLDEPMGGLTSEMIQKLCKNILSLQSMGKTIVVIEHNMSVAMSLCEQITVLDHGTVIAEGPPESIQRDERVIRAYLGG